jgi:hypothetical protein
MKDGDVPEQRFRDDRSVMMTGAVVSAVATLRFPSGRLFVHDHAGLRVPACSFAPRGRHDPSGRPRW